MLLAIDPDIALQPVPPTDEVLEQLRVASRVTAVLRRQLRICKLADKESPRRRRRKRRRRDADASK